MEMSAFQELAEKKFKGVYWLTQEPLLKQDEERRATFLEDKEESLEGIAMLGGEN